MHPNISFPKVHYAGSFHRVALWILSGTFRSLKEHRKHCASQSLQTCVRNTHIQFIIICSRYSYQWAELSKYIYFYQPHFYMACVSSKCIHVQFFFLFKSSLIISFGGLLAAFFSHGSIEKDPPTMLCICDALCLKCLWLFYWNSPTIWGAKVQIDKILEYICDFWVCVCVQPQLGMIHMYVSLRTDVMLLI